MIEIKDLFSKKGDFQLAVQELRIKPGLTAIIGENGAGKSTFLQILSTALEPDKGQISYVRKSLADSLPMIRSQIGYCPTGIELYEEMTPLKLLNYLAQLKGISITRREKVINQLIEDFRMSEIKDKKIKYLSEGMKQQVAILQTLLNRPAFVFLDEPCTYLDIQERNHLASYFSLYANQKIVLVVTHEFSLWEKYCDYVLWMNEGKIRFYGSIKEWKEIGESVLTMEDAYFTRKNGF